jgi:transposase
MSQWLFEGLAKAGLPIFCIETRQAKTFLDALQPNKIDRNDVRHCKHDVGRPFQGRACERRSIRHVTP